MANQQQRSPLQQLIDRFEEKYQIVFKPKREFYESNGINPKRFGQILHGLKSPDSKEIKKLLTYFNQYFHVSAEELLESDCPS